MQAPRTSTTDAVSDSSAALIACSISGSLNASTTRTSVIPTARTMASMSTDGVASPRMLLPVPACS